MANNEIKDMLLDLKKGQEKLINRVDKIEEGQQNMNNRLDKIEEGQQNMNNRLDKIEEGQQNMNNRLDKISQSVAVIEKDHGEKLQVLLDVVTEHIKKFDSENSKIEKCKERLDDHDNKIYALNSVVQAY